MYRLDLISVLQQEGHSGIIEGNCRVHYSGDFLSTKDYFEDDNSDNFVDVTFSQGIHALGTFKFQGVQFTTDVVSGNLELKHLDTKDEVLIEIDTEISGMANFSKFRAVLYKNGKNITQEELNFLNKSLSSFDDLPTRILTILKNNDIRNFGEILSFSITDIFKFKRGGKKTACIIDDFVKKHGYSLKK